MFDSKPRQKAGEPIEELVGEAIDLTASDSSGDAEAAREQTERREPGRARPENGHGRGADNSGRWPWDRWNESGLRAALVAVTAVAAVEALALIVLLVASPPWG